MANDIYAREVVLLLVSCQGCDAASVVCVSEGVRDPRPLRERPQPLAYGDPPERCCRMGSSMSSETRQVLEVWALEEFQWVRIYPDEFLASSKR